jgi:hypothetical protein
LSPPSRRLLATLWTSRTPWTTLPPPSVSGGGAPVYLSAAFY